ncbi:MULTISPECIES: hypothetical protein [unclassified Wolbachia]|uniref:hypothetical protein n=1 Tax=unclassified Wolbachia TaxID=2640676 RepID=UPI00125098EB|nr:hypothetical protein [Wolbachia endosymbiont of Nasonia oneida]KAB2978077.1 hypothetical protein DEF52_03595 [Wolbachia endosymbiont of Nasonia oneida]
MSNHINIPPLDTNTRKKIINEHLKETKPDLLKRVLDETKGFSPANLIILLRELEEKKFTSASKVGEFCQHFKKTHGIDNVSNKQRTNEETLNTLEKTPLQETASSLKMIKDLSSEHSSELGKIDKDKFVNELPSLSHMSTPKTKNSTQYRTKPPRKSPKKKDEDENKENSEQLNHENLDTNINSPHLSPFKDTTNNSYYTLTM